MSSKVHAVGCEPWTVNENDNPHTGTTNPIPLKDIISLQRQEPRT